jgi:hypothetical protein
LHGVYIERKDLNLLSDLVRSHYESIGFTAECSDHTVRFFENVSQLTEYQNPASASIKILSIRGKNENGDKDCELEFGSSSPNNIKIEIKGEESDLILFSNKLDSIVAGMKSWYSWLSTGLLKSFSIVPFFLIIPSMFLSGMLQIKGSMILPGDSPALTIDRLILAMVIFIVLLFAIAIIHSLLFPLAGFEIGQGIKRSKSQRTWRIIIGGAIVSLIVAIIATRIGWPF